MILKTSNMARRINDFYMKNFKARSEWEEDGNRVIDIPLPLIGEQPVSPVRKGMSTPLIPRSAITPGIGISPTGLQLSLQVRKKKEEPVEEQLVS